MNAYDYLMDSIESFITRNNYIFVGYAENWAPQGSLSIRVFYKEKEEETILTKDFEF